MIETSLDSTSVSARFRKDRYIVLRDLLVEPMLSVVANYAMHSALSGKMVDGDIQAPDTPCAYGDPMMETVLENCRAAIEEATGLALHPTYAFFRVYKQGDVLKRHSDRESCEISASLALRCIGAVGWPLCIEGPAGPFAAELKSGDSLVYRGCECPHWREAFAGDHCAQVFLHYVDANGPFSEWRYDKRESLNSISENV